MAVSGHGKSGGIRSIASTVFAAERDFFQHSRYESARARRQRGTAESERKGDVLRSGYCVHTVRNAAVVGDDGAGPETVKGGRHLGAGAADRKPRDKSGTQGRPQARQ